MIDRLARAREVLVDDGESGAAHVVGRAEGGAQLFDEGGLACPHLAVESKETFFGESLQKLAGCRRKTVQTCGYLHFHQIATNNKIPPKRRCFQSFLLQINKKVTQNTLNPDFFRIFAG